MALIGVDYEVEDGVEKTLIIEDVSVDLPLPKVHKLIFRELAEHGIACSQVLRCYWVYSFGEAVRR